MTPPIRGDIRTDGKIYWAKDTRMADGDLWVNPHVYVRYRLNDVLGQIRRRSNKQTTPCNLDIDYLITLLPRDMKCPILGIPLVWGGGNQNRMNSPSVDRIDPKSGYCRGNVRIISNRANMLKSNATLDELRLIVTDLEKISTTDERHC